MGTSLMGADESDSELSDENSVEHEPVITENTIE